MKRWPYGKELKKEKRKKAEGTMVHGLYIGMKLMWAP